MRRMGKTRYRQDMIFIFVLFVALVFSLWKANKGFADIDEGFYLTLPKRFLQGDSLLVDEWNMAQFSGLLLLPFMAVYNALSSSTDGIILVFRWVYIAVQLLFSIYIYSCLRDRRGALWAVIPFMFYAPFNIMALSYNSMGIQSLTAALSSLCCSNRCKTKLVIAGLFFAAAVLCNPYLALVYFIYAFCALSLLLLKKLQLHNKELFISKEGFLLFTAGCALLALPTLVMLLREPLDKILLSLPVIFSDPEHPPVTLINKFFIYLQCVFYSSPYSMRAMALLLLSLLLWLVDSRLFKARHSDLLFLLSLAAVFVYIAGIMVGRRYVNCIMFPVNLAGLSAYLTAREKDRRLFWFFWVPAMLYSFFSNAASNQAFYAISSSSTPATVPSILFILRRVRQCNTETILSSIVRAASALCIAATIVLLLGLRSYYCYWDVPTPQLEVKLDSGFNAGLWTSSQRAEEYERLLSETEFVRAQTGKVLYYSGEYYLYLMDSKEMASYSAWLSVRPDTHNELWRLGKYYSIQPEKLPDYIYLSKAVYVSPDMVMEAFGLEAEVIENADSYVLKTVRTA